MIELSKYLKELLKQYKPYDKEIFNLIKKGSAFHHAGLREQLRTSIEDLFKEHIIKIISY